MTRAEEVLAKLLTETEIAARTSNNSGLKADAEVLRQARVSTAQAGRTEATNRLHQQHGTGRDWVSPTTTT